MDRSQSLILKPDMCLWNKNISNCFDYRFVVIYDDTSAALYTDDGNDVDDEEEIMLKICHS